MGESANEHLLGERSASEAAAGAGAAASQELAALQAGLASLQADVMPGAPMTDSPPGGEQRQLVEPSPPRGALPALRAVGGVRMKGSKKALASMLAAQGHAATAPRPIDEDLAEVLQDQLRGAEERLMEAAAQVEDKVQVIQTVSGGAETDDVKIQDWDDGEFLGGDSQVDDSLLTAPRALPTPPSRYSPPQTPPTEFVAANPHQIEESRTILDSRERFRKYDSDRDGELDAHEVARMFRDMELQVDEHTMYALIDRFDTDRSGTIDYAEFGKLCLYLNVGTEESWSEKRKLGAETSRVETAIPRYLEYIGDNHPQVASMCEYCAGLMHRQGRITESQAMAQQAKEIRQQAEPPEEHVLVRRFADDD